MTDHAPATLEATETAPRGSVQRMVRRFKACRHPKNKRVNGPREEMMWGTGPTQYCTACGASRNMLHRPGPWRPPNFEDLADLEKSKPSLMGKIRAILKSPNVPDQRPCATGVRLGTETQSWGSLHPVCSA